MLSRLVIRNFAIIDEVELELAGGLTVLTGETGAGKSILIDALGLALGDRASATVVRHGAARAEITVEVDVAAVPALAGWLAEQSLDLDGECLLRRVIGADGRSRAYVNGNPVPLQNLRAVGELVVDIHGQHAHQSLTRAPVQRELLDHHGGHGALRERVSRAWRRWHEASEAREQLARLDEERDRRIDYLRFQAEELDAAAVDADELVELERERARLANAGRLAEGVQTALGRLYEGEDANAQALIAAAARDLGELAAIDGSLEEAARLAGEAEVLVGEAAEALRRYAADLEADPERAELVETRLAAIADLARKHRVAPEALPGEAQRLAEELAGLEQAEARLGELERELRSARTEWEQAAGALSEARLAAAAAFGEAVTAAMQELGMQGGRFEIAVEPALESKRDSRRDPKRDSKRDSRSEPGGHSSGDPDGDASAEPGGDAAPREHGRDRIEFRVAANPGQPPQPLARVASGGELSRIGLAIEVIAADGNEVPTMIFDEVDAGVGGGVAEIVGRRLRALGEHRQVLCVTHLPQVASQAHRHLRIAKLTDGKTTRTSMAMLSDAERVEEIARMLGGVEITERTRRHAEEMLGSDAGRRPPDRKGRTGRAGRSA